MTKRERQAAQAERERRRNPIPWAGHTTPPASPPRTLPDEHRLGIQQSGTPRLNSGSWVNVGTSNKRWRGESAGATTVDVPARDSRWDRYPINPISIDSVHKFRNRNS